jgi:hypothetical protein
MAAVFAGSRPFFFQRKMFLSMNFADNFLGLKENFRKNLIFEID